MERNSDSILSEWLVLGAQMGDRAALSQLISLWRTKLLRYAQRQVGVTQAEDVVQLCLETVVRDLSKVRDPASFPKWLYQILQRRCVDELRSRQRARRIFSDLNIVLC